MNRIINYYRSSNGSCYVKEFIDSLNPKVQEKIFWTLRLLKELEFLKEPYFKKMIDTSDIWECRIQYSSNIYRIFFFFDNKNVILTHGFIKKTNKTPRHEIKRAENIRKDYFKGKYH
ncbi:MAG: type II toxin-antitoxin system RelE/ParE family toxin [Pseudomonadota bacterium]